MKSKNKYFYSDKALETVNIYAVTELSKDHDVSDVLTELMKEMSGDGLFIPETCITIRNVVGEGKSII